MFTRENSVLMVIDVQGKLAQIVYEHEQLIRSLEIIIQGMHALKVPILWVEQTPSKLGPTRDRLAKLLCQSTKPIEKQHFSVYREPEALAAFEALNRKQVVLTGIETHICLQQTACDLINKGYEVQVAADCVSSRTRENYELGLQRMLLTGAQITSVEMILFELLQKPDGEAFRTIARLVK